MIRLFRRSLCREKIELSNSSVIFQRTTFPSQSGDVHFAPVSQLSATITHGKQKLGKLFSCSLRLVAWERVKTLVTATNRKLGPIREESICSPTYVWQKLATSRNVVHTYVHVSEQTNETRFDAYTERHVRRASFSFLRRNKR